MEFSAAPGYLSINLISINLNSMNELVHESKKTHNFGNFRSKRTLRATY